MSSLDASASSICSFSPLILSRASLLQFVDFDTNLFFLVAWHIAEVGHKGIDFTLLAEILDAKLLYFFCVLGSQSISLLSRVLLFFLITYLI